MPEVEGYLNRDIDLAFIELDFLVSICQGKNPFGNTPYGSRILTLLQNRILPGSKPKQLNKQACTPRLKAFLSTLAKTQVTAIYVICENIEKNDRMLIGIQEMLEDVDSPYPKFEFIDVIFSPYAENDPARTGESEGPERTDFQKKGAALREDLVKERLLTKESPASLQIELTSACNIKCRMCPTVDMSRKKGFMEMETYQAIIEKAAAAGIGLIRFTLFGEALLHPDVVEMIRLAKEKDLAVGLNTNGLALNPQLSRQIIEAGLDSIIFSFDGATKETYENIRINSDFEKVQDNIRNFVDIRNELQSKIPHTRIQMIPMKDSLEEIEDFKRKWSGIIDEVAITYTYAMDKALHEQMERPASFVPHCRYPWDLLVVYYDGTVGYCCKDVEAKLVLGNIKDHSFEELWNAPTLTEIRKNLRREDMANLPTLCGHCYIDSQWF